MDISSQPTANFAGIKPEFRQGFICQIRSFAVAGREEALKLDSLGNAWVKGIEESLNKLQSIFGLRNRAFDQILHHSREGDINKGCVLSSIIGWVSQT